MKCESIILYQVNRATLARKAKPLGNNYLLLLERSVGIAFYINVNNAVKIKSGISVNTKEFLQVLEGDNV